MKASTVIHTIRHAQTEYSASKRYAGSIDVPLSDAGMREAGMASAVLKGVRFDVVITSTLQRSIETARILVGDAAPVIHCELCNERRFGVLEGHTWDKVKEASPPILLIEVGGDWHTVNPQGAERLEDLWQRAKRFLRFLLKEHKGRTILVVSHGVFLQMFHGLLKGLSCIESLAVYPASLEQNVFTLCGKRLVKHATANLSRRDTVKF